MPNGLLILSAFALYGLFVYGPDLARYIGRKRKIIGVSYKIVDYDNDSHTITVAGDITDALANDSFSIRKKRLWIRRKR